MIAWVSLGYQAVVIAGATIPLRESAPTSFIFTPMAHLRLTGIWPSQITCVPTEQSLRNIRQKKFVLPRSIPTTRTNITMLKTTGSSASSEMLFDVESQSLIDSMMSPLGQNPKNCCR
ncbi:hypothetical protein AOQ72_18435 [Bradyrhizobium yuanmingense]|uniref:Uncharacterized protein n=1 Tax=Bradyrhizobium yuanmingense TaxID=108015 RepID=A0A0R3CK06_9BRAD|nr:hypothetical protein AOQ72_18435 [Bradyrhizobium yuanmingense]